VKVKLMGYTQTVPGAFIGIDNLQDFVAYCARVSNPINQMNSETAEKLIKYLIKHKHWSPLEMVSATMEIETTRDIARQLLRHRSFSFQEFSQRYADPADMDGVFETSEARLQDTKNRQNSIETDDAELQVQWNINNKLLYKKQKKHMNGLLKTVLQKNRLVRFYQKD